MGNISHKAQKLAKKLWSSKMNPVPNYTLNDDSFKALCSITTCHVLLALESRNLPILAFKVQLTLKYFFAKISLRLSLPNFDFL